jgi:hypothetical protein
MEERMDFRYETITGIPSESIVLVTKHCHHTTILLSMFVSRNGRHLEAKQSRNLVSQESTKRDIPSSVAGRGCFSIVPW